MPNDTAKSEFLDAVRDSIADGAFLKLTLGKYRGEGEDRRCVATLVMLKEQPNVRFLTHRGTQDITENERPEEALERLSGMIGADFLSAVLFTSRADIALAYSRKRVGRLTRGRPTLAEAPATRHDREKALEAVAFDLAVGEDFTAGDKTRRARARLDREPAQHDRAAVEPPHQRLLDRLGDFGLRERRPLAGCGRQHPRDRQGGDQFPHGERPWRGCRCWKSVRAGLTKG